jgi:hypothetical protein
MEGHDYFVKKRGCFYNVKRKTLSSQKGNLKG